MMGSSSGGRECDEQGGGKGDIQGGLKTVCDSEIVSLGVFATTSAFKRLIFLYPSKFWFFAVLRESKFCGEEGFVMNRDFFTGGIPDGCTELFEEKITKRRVRVPDAKQEGIPDLD